VSDTRLTKRDAAKDRVVQRLRDIESAIATVARADQAKLLMDVAAAQEIFAQRQQLGEKIIGHAHRVKSMALARLGELLDEMEKQAGGRGRPGPGRGKRGSKIEPRFDAPPTLSEVLNLPKGQAKKLSSVAQQFAALPDELREAIAQRETTLSKVRREQKAAEIRKAVSLPDAKYRVIYADPPWCYNDKADEGAIQSGGVGRHYPSMNIAELCSLPVAPICEDNAVLFMWTTSPLLFECAPVFKAWGFAYKACFIWDKIKHNMGHYNSVRHELLLVCTRGSCTPDKMELFDSVQSIERTEHSAKPEEFREIIETLYPHGKKLELFARRVTQGWDAFGYEAGKATA
jgi:N6-adenosine-specific RNA methylase IME4